MTVGGFGTALTLTGAMVLAGGSATAAPAEKVQICHATGSESNPYVVNQVDSSSIDEEGNKFLNGHGDHIGPVFDPDDPQKSWGDIIPPITNPDTGTTFDGLNWPAGEVIWLNGCQVPTPSPTPTETSPTPTETSPTPTETSPTPTITVTETVTAPGPTSTVTQTIIIPGPGTTATVVVPGPTVTAPGPTVTEPGPTQTVTETPIVPSPGVTTATATATATVTASPSQTGIIPAPAQTVTIAPGTLPTGVDAGNGPSQSAPLIGWLGVLVALIIGGLGAERLISSRQS